MNNVINNENLKEKVIKFSYFAGSTSHFKDETASRVNACFSTSHLNQKNINLLRNFFSAENIQFICKNRTKIRLCISHFPFYELNLSKIRKQIELAFLKFDFLKKQKSKNHKPVNTDGFPKQWIHNKNVY